MSDLYETAPIGTDRRGIQLCSVTARRMAESYKSSTLRSRSEGGRPQSTDRPDYFAAATAVLSSTR